MGYRLLFPSVIHVHFDKSLAAVGTGTDTASKKNVGVRCGDLGIVEAFQVDLSPYGCRA